MNVILVYFITLFVFFIIDILWLGIFAKNLYRKELSHLLSKKTNWKAAIIFYLVFIFGLVFFVVNPSIEIKSSMNALLNGLIFGFVSYATYDLTNLATIKNWPLKITVIDLIWGSVLGASVSYLSTLINLSI